MRLSAVIGLLLIAAVQLYAQDPSAKGFRQLQIPDIEVLNQVGQLVRFNSGIIRNRIAVIGTIFTTCKTICPITGEKFQRLESMLKDRLGRDVILVSVSVDPVKDSPERLKAWGDKFHVGKGWVLVTGNKPDIDLLLKSLDLFVPEPQDHSSSVLIGSSTTGWIPADPLRDSTTDLLKLIERVSADREKSSTRQMQPAARSFGVTLADKDRDAKSRYDGLLPSEVVTANQFVAECEVGCYMVQ